MIARLRERLGGVPEQVRSAVALEPGERLLSWAGSPHGPVVASSWRLWLPAGADAGSSALDWDRIDKATWASPVLGISPATGAPEQRLRLDPSRDLPAVVRTKVTQAVAYSRKEGLGPVPGGVRIVGRRSARTRELRWELVYDPGTPTEDPRVLARARQLLAEAQSELAAGVVG